MVILESEKANEWADVSCPLVLAGGLMAAILIMERTMANLTDYYFPETAKQILRDAISDDKKITLLQFGYDANLGGETMIFEVGEDRLEAGIFYLDDANIEKIDDVDDCETCLSRETCNVPCIQQAARKETDGKDIQIQPRQSQSGQEKEQEDQANPIKGI